MGFSLSRFGYLRKGLTGLRRRVFVFMLGMDIHPTVRMSLSAKPDLTFPEGVHIDANSYVAFNARILTHDFTRGLYLHTRIGKNCFIGGESLILPGISIGDGSVIGAGSVVTKDVPPRTMVAGNPAEIIRTNIEVGPFGRLLGADDNERMVRVRDPRAASLPSSLEH